jgi:hypothetical protein
MLQEASFIDFLGYLFIILLLLGIFSRLFIQLMPVIIRFLLKRRMETMQRQFFDQQTFKEKKEQSQYNNSSANNTGRKSSKEKKIVGEYIDFEEIE